MNFIIKEKILLVMKLLKVIKLIKFFFEINRFNSKMKQNKKLLLKIGKNTIKLAKQQ